MQGTWVQSLVGERRSYMLLRAAKEREREKKKRCTRKRMYVSFRWKHFKNFLLQQLLLFSRSVMFDSLWPPWTAAPQASLSFTISWSLLQLMSIEFMMPSNHLILCHPPSPPALNLSQHQGVSQWVGSSHQGPKEWSFSFSIRPSSEGSGLISFRIDWFYLAVQGPPM